MVPSRAAVSFDGPFRLGHIGISVWIVRCTHHTRANHRAPPELEFELMVISTYDQSELLETLTLRSLGDVAETLHTRASIQATSARKNSTRAPHTSIQFMVKNSKTMLQATAISMHGISNRQSVLLDYFIVIVLPRKTHQAHYQYEG